LRLQRERLGYTQDRLGQLVGLSFQQIQKYERGTNRISASRLFEFSRALGVDVDFFFADIALDGTPVPLKAAELAFALDPSAQRLVAAFESLTDENLRRRLLELVATLAGEHGSKLTKLRRRNPPSSK
jgi:transcriptional regulator with XRE-family HTH domain